MQRGIELSSDLFDTYTILPVREAIKNLLKDDDNIDVNDNDDDWDDHINLFIFIC